MIEENTVNKMGLVTGLLDKTVSGWLICVFWLIEESALIQQFGKLLGSTATGQKLIGVFDLFRERNYREERV